MAAEHEGLSRDTGGKPGYDDIVMVANLQTYVGQDHPHARVDHSWVLRPTSSGDAPGHGECPTRRDQFGYRRDAPVLHRTAHLSTRHLLVQRHHGERLLIVAAEQIDPVGNQARRGPSRRLIAAHQHLLADEADHRFKYPGSTTVASIGTTSRCRIRHASLHPRKVSPGAVR